MNTARDRLLEWAFEQFYPGWEVPTPSGAFAGMVNKRRRKTLLERLLWRRVWRSSPNHITCKETRSTKMELIVHDGGTAMCPPDGGLGRMVDRMAASIDRSKRAAEVGECLRFMPSDLRAIVRVRYEQVVNPRELPRQDVECIRMLNIPERTYFYRKKAMLTWLGRRLGIQHAAAT